MQGLTARLLGPPELLWRGRSLDISATKPLTLAFVLAVRREAVPKDLIAELLWTNGKRSNVRSALYTLRRDAKGNEWLSSTEHAVQLVGTSDLAGFEQAMRARDHHEALAIWRSAGIVGSSREALLQGFPIPSVPTFHDWLELERARVSALYLDCLSLRAAELEQERSLSDAVALLRELVGEDPLNEDAHRRIMQIEWRRGRAEAALEQFHACRKILSDELGLAPVSSTVALFESILEQTKTPTQTSISFGPEETALGFVGREGELDELEALLGRRRLITLLGPGGVGKTRLVRELIRRVEHTRPQRAVFVPLSALRDTRFAVAAIINAMRITSRGPEAPIVQLCNALRDRATLLVLDNAEHLAGLDEIVRALLDEVPDLTIVATSRRALGLEIEEKFAVSGLPFPVTDHDPDGASRDAVRLFVTAARRIDTSFSLTAATAAAVFRICRQLQGHPLGLELAAGWLRFHDCEALADSLDRQLLQLENPGLPVNERHASLRMVMERSWDASTPEEQGYLAALCVFRGSFGLPAAQGVASLTMTGLMSLIDQSLVRAMSDGRFDLHPLVQEFGREKLALLADRDAVRARHAAFYLDRLAGLHATILGEAPGPALDSIEKDFEDVREAWMHAASQVWEEPLLAAGRALGLFADMRVRFHDAVQLFGDAIRVLEQSPTTDPKTTALLRVERGTHLYRLSRYEDAMAEADAAIEAIPSEEKAALHKALRLKAVVLGSVGRYLEARALQASALGLSRDIGREYVSRDLRTLANLETCIGLYPEAEAHYREALGVDAETGYLIGRAINLNNLAELLILMGRPDEAEGMIEESLGYARGVDVHLVPYLTLNRAELEYRRGRLSAAREDASNSKRLAEEYGQASVRSRSAALLGRLAMAEQDLEASRRWLAEAVRVAYDERELASLMHAFVSVAELAAIEGDDALAAQYLSCVVANPASEYSTVAATEPFLESSLHPEKQTIPMEELVEIAVALRL